MTNTNILEGMRCPECGSEGPFRIEAISIFVVYDEGADEHSGVSWDNDSLCECDQCDHSGTVQAFTIEKEAAA